MSQIKRILSLNSSIVTMSSSCQVTEELRAKMWHRIGEKLGDNGSIASRQRQTCLTFNTHSVKSYTLFTRLNTMNLQTGERSPPLKTTSEALPPCPCQACFPRKDFSNEALLSHPRDIYNHNRVVGFGSQMSMFPFTPIPSSPASIFAPHGLHRASYPRAVFAPVAPESRYSLAHNVQDIPKRSNLREGHLVQSQTPDTPGTRYWDQTSSAGSQEKPRRMRTVFSPQQLERLERHFKIQQYVGSAQRIYIASQLGLSETQVKVWFQNRRIRWRKQVLGGAMAKTHEDS